MRHNLRRPKLHDIVFSKDVNRGEECIWTKFQNLLQGFLSSVSLCFRPLLMSNQSIPTFDNLSKPLVHSKSEQHKLLCCCMLHMIEHCSLWILCLKKIKLLIFTLFADVIHQVMLFQQAQTIQFFVILVFKWLFCFYSKSSPQRCFPLKSCPTPLRRAAHPSIQHFSRHVLTLRNVPEKFCKVSKNDSLSDKSGK